MFSTGRFIFWLLLIVVTVNCDNLIVKTDNGKVRGVAQTTFLNQKEYIAYRGIPYAEPPVGNLRYKVPVPVASWRETLPAYEYGNSCLALAQSQLFPWNHTQSEDCLFLNVFTPVTESKKENAKKAVMFFIHGGAFTEGDGTNGFYGPDFIVDDDVVLVTCNYRLGPWGFSNFDLKGYTGNMGFKDQQLALEWVKRNINNFGGNPNLITIFGQSAGGAAVHFQMLSERSRKSMRRAIPMSGVAFANFARYQPNNHIELYKEIFELDPQATGQDVLQFMKNAPVDVIIQKLPAITIDQSMAELYFAAVIEDAKKAESPFLTQRPRDIYETSRVNVDAMFGFTSAEFLSLLNPTDLYAWIEPMKNLSNIALPFSGLTLSQESCEYKEGVKKIYDFYFGTRELAPTLENLNAYVQLSTDLNFAYPAYEALKMHSTHATTFCYENQLMLNLNAIKIQNNIQELYGTSHFEDLQYLFLSKKYAQLYIDVISNLADPINQKTLAALRFVPRMFTTYAKYGLPGLYPTFTPFGHNGVGITNDGLKSMFGIKQDAMSVWAEVHQSLKPWIVKPF